MDTSNLKAGLNLLAMYLLMGLLKGLACLPYRLQKPIGQGLGKLLFKVLRRRRVVTEKNLDACFPELSPQQRQQLMQRSFAACGRGVIEASLAWWASPQRLARMTEVEGFTHIQKALAQGRGVIVITPHLTTLEMAARVLALHQPCVAVQRQQKNLVFDRLVQARRLEYVDGLVLHEDIRGMLRALRAGKVLCILPDQDMGRHRSVFAPFFGLPAATITGIARLAKLSQAPVVPGFCYAHAQGGTRYTLSFSPVLQDYPSGNAEQDATAMNAALEAGIRRQPEQYIWSHRRFKTRPPGEPAIY